MLTRRQILRSLCAAALAAVAPIPAIAAAVPSPARKLFVPKANLLDLDGPCPCCCCDDPDPSSMMISVANLPMIPDGTYRAVRQVDGTFSAAIDDAGIKFVVSRC